MAANIGNTATQLPENENADEPSMEEILSSIKQIIADDEQSDGAPENRENYTYPENPSNSNRSEADVEEVELSAALQAELNGIPTDDTDSKSASPSAGQKATSGSDGQAREDLKTRVAAVRAELSSTSEALSPEQRLQHYRSRNKLKSEASTRGNASSAVQTSTPMPSESAKQPVPVSPAQIIASPAPEAVAQEMATIMLKEKSGELETMLADLMRPTIRQWLNDNLPSMVQRLVREEIRAASRGRKTS